VALALHFLQGVVDQVFGEEGMLCHPHHDLESEVVLDLMVECHKTH
jgi:hypothetical protein